MVLSSNLGQMFDDVRFRRLWSRLAPHRLTIAAAVVAVAMLCAGVALATAMSPGAPAKHAAALGSPAATHATAPHATAAHKPRTARSRTPAVRHRPVAASPVPRHHVRVVHHRPAVHHAHLAALTTSCRNVAHIGDSTTVGMVSPAVIPDPAQRLGAQYGDVGVKHVYIHGSGGRSIVEALPGQVNGYGVAQHMDDRGFHGCWVIALGTNDTADVAVGSNVGRAARIAEMMALAHGAPVLWVNVKTALTGGPWAESEMRLWNQALMQACSHYPNMRVFNWASVVNNSWFLSDGIHYTSAGFAARAHLIAHALARAFPRTGHSNRCLIP